MKAVLFLALLATLTLTPLAAAADEYELCIQRLPEPSPLCPSAVGVRVYKVCSASAPLADVCVYL